MKADFRSGKHVFVTALAILVLLPLSACAAGPTPAATTGTPAPIKITRGGSSAASGVSGRAVRIAADQGQTPPTGLEIGLSEGTEAAAAAEPPAPVAPAQPISDTLLMKLLARLPALPTPPGDYQVFAVPAQSLPAPRTGLTVQEPFPPAATPAPPEQEPAGPLEVLRYAPEGDVTLAPYLSVTFNQPMVALTGLQDLAALDVPVRLSPTPPGEWRWIGTRTLEFHPKGRFPMATKYAAQVPAGTTSAVGGKLSKAVSWTFNTPPPQLQTSFPTESPQPLDPILFASFDQRIDPGAVLETVKVSAGDESATIRLATAEEVQKDEAVRRLAATAGEGRWLAFRAAESYPSDTQVTVVIGPGTPSAEGPLTTGAPQSFGFHTYGPLQVVEHQCGWGGPCTPLSPWTIRFSNPLNESAFREAHVRISPELPAANVNVSADTLLIQGRSSGRTTYQVTLSKEISDQFGQTLGEDVTLTFKVGSAEPVFWAPGGNFVVIDPTAVRPAYSVYTINYDRLKAQAYTVRPQDWAAFKAYLMAYYSDKPVSPPGKLAFSKTIEIKARADELTETAVDLGPALPEGLGHVVLIVEPENTGLKQLLEPWQRPPIAQAWIQSTRIGLDAAVDNANLVAWANALADGAPLAGVEVSLLGQSTAAAAGVKTDAEGLATLPLPADRAALLVGRKGGDVAILPADAGPWGEGGWARSSRSDSLRWYTFDDRGIYRPGEEVHLKGWIRRIGAGPEGDVGPLMGAAELLRYRMMDSRGNEILNGTTELNAFGGFTLAFTLTETMNLGPANVEFTTQGGTGGVDNIQHYHTFQVQEFRRPEFEVKTTASEGPHLVGGSATVEVSANYYAGGGLPDAEVTWTVRQSTAQYSPPGWDDFTFGTWVPWWRGWSPGGESVQRVQTFTGRTDASGVHRLKLDFESVNPPEPTSVTAEATVMDVNRQAWSSSTVLLVHPAELYVGLRTDRMFVEREDPLRVDAIVTDLDGKAVPGREIKMQAARLDWKNVNGEWQEVETVVQPCTVQSAAKPVRCTFETPEGGTYRITATIADDQGRANRSELTRWVSGGQQPPSREVEQEQATLIPDRKEYQPGDTAEILVLSPFYPAEGLLTLRRSGLVSTERFTMDGPSTTIKVPIKDAYIPNLHVQVDLVGSAPRTDDNGEVQKDLPRRPAFATGEINLPVPPWERALSLEVTPRDAKIAPGGQTTVDVVVRDANGAPVPGAELAVVVVDEAVLALTGYQIADPLDVFYTERSADVSDYHLRSSILLARPEDLMNGTGQAMAAAGMEKQLAREADMGMAPMAAAAPTAAPAAAEAGGMGAGAAPIAMRTDFNPLAAFVPSVTTDAQGRAAVPVKLPDNLTRYRVTVVAVTGESSKLEAGNGKLAGKQFGKGESAITARLPLMVRPSPPRFLNFGDRFELPVVLQNQTDAAMQVDVAVRASNAVLTDGAGFRVTVPANDRVEVRFPATTASAGTARFQVVAAQSQKPEQKPGFSPAVDAAQFELPVWTPATTEAFAVYGVVDSGGVSQPVIAPTNVYTQFGGLEITTSSTALQELTDAVLYLVSYPFECSEQLASRILGVAALRDVLSAFEAEGLPTPEEMEAAVARDIERLRGMQNPDGGFPIWRRGQESWPYNSIHVANALQRAKLKGYVVPEEMLTQANGYLRDIENNIPADWGPDIRNTLVAYALNVRKQMGDADPARARRLVNEVGLEKLSPEAIGWILPVLSDDPASVAETEAIRRELNNRVTETAGAAHFVADYGDEAYLLLYSNRRADGIILEALIGDQPDSDLIPKLVRGLLSGRKAGHWANTQEDVFILLALDRYFNTYEAETPDFVARIWLGDTYAGETEFRGRTTDYKQTDVPMSIVAEKTGSQDLILTKEGAGRLYYRMGMKYAPTDLQLPPLDRGFAVERSYEGVDNPGDVRRDATGAWHVKAGARVRVVLSMYTPARRYHVALVDPLPAGLEALNPALAVTGDVPEGTDPQKSWWWGPWYEHQNLRDERAEAFSTLLWEGVYTYSYVTRATTPGQYVVPPAKAEEMYAPETFGRSAADRVIVE